MAVSTTEGSAVALHANIAMSRLLILGATGSLGRHVLRQALAAGHAVTVSVRTPSKLPPEVRERVSVHSGDLGAVVPPDLVSGQDALINGAGHVADGEAFVAMVDTLVTWIVPYADAAALMLANLDRGDAMSRHRVGLALPVGMRGRKPR